MIILEKVILRPSEFEEMTTIMVGIIALYCSFAVISYNQFEYIVSYLLMIAYICGRVYVKFAPGFEPMLIFSTIYTTSLVCIILFSRQFQERER